MFHRFWQARRLWVFLAATLGLATPLAAQEFRDSDWSHAFYANCPLPNAGSLGWTGGVDRALQVRLAPGDVGGCSSDGAPRHGVSFHERAEVKQRGTLAMGQRHDIRFQVSFDSGLRGREESFFQIHGWTKTCASPPIVMLQFDGRKLQPMVLQRASSAFKAGGNRGEKGSLAPVRSGFGTARLLRHKALIGGTHDFRVALDLQPGDPRVSVFMDGTTLVDNAQLHLMDCVEPHVKFGLYRPGKVNRAASSLRFDKIRITSGG